MEDENLLEPIDSDPDESLEPANKRTRTQLSLNTKIQIIQNIENGMKPAEVARSYNIDRATIYRLLRMKDAILKRIQNNPYNLTQSKLLTPVYDTLDKAMTLYVQQCIDNDETLSNNQIQEKSTQFAKALGIKEFRGSVGWLTRFRARHGFETKTNPEYLKTQQLAKNIWIEQIFTKLLQKYPEKDIFFTDETGLLYTVGPGNSFTLKRDRCLGGTHSATRVTLLLSCNMNGSEKLKPMMVGKFGRPESFKGLAIENLPVFWEFNKEAWMTQFSFERWLLQMEKKFQNQNRKVLMFVNPYMVHPKQLQNQLKFIQLEFVPQEFFSINNPGNLQPMKTHIFRAIKLYYRNQLIKDRLAAIAQKVDYQKPTVLDCIRRLTKIWECTLTPEMITNFFQSTGFTSSYNNVLVDCPVEGKQILQSIETEMSINFSALQKHDETVARDCWEDYVDVDKSASICDILRDEDILEMFGGAKEEQELEKERLVKIKKFKELTVPEMKESLFKVHQTLELAPGVPTDIFQCLTKIDHYLDSIVSK